MRKVGGGGGTVEKSLCGKWQENTLHKHEKQTKRKQF